MSNQSQPEPEPKPRFQKAADIPAKYMPPKPTGPNGEEIPWSEDPQTIAYIMRYAENMRQAEIDAELYAKHREEERLQMEAYQKRQRERRKQMLLANKKAVGPRLRRFALGEYYRCDYCSQPLSGWLMSDLRRLVNKIGINEAVRLLE